MLSIVAVQNYQCTLRFFLTKKQSENKIQSAITTMTKRKVMAKCVSNVVLRHVSLQIAFNFNPLFLFEGTLTEGPVTSSPSPAPSKICGW